MTITHQNEERVRAFIDIMRHCNVPKETAGMIIAMLPNETAMDEMVEYIKNNLQATEDEIFKEAERISKV